MKYIISIIFIFFAPNVFAQKTLIYCEPKEDATGVGTFEIDDKEKTVSFLENIIAEFITFNKALIVWETPDKEGTKFTINRIRNTYEIYHPPMEKPSRPESTSIWMCEIIK